MAKKIVIKPAGLPVPVSPYNQAVRAGDLLFCAGQVPLDPVTGGTVPQAAPAKPAPRRYPPEIPPERRSEDEEQ